MAKKVGRPRSSPNEKRRHVVPIRFSTSEMELARHRAELEGLSVAAVVRRALKRDLSGEQDQHRNMR